MIIYSTAHRLILEENGNRLYCNRADGSFSAPGDDFDFHDDAVPCGEVEFLIGQLQIEDNIFLFFVADSVTVAHYRGAEENTKHEIRRIERVVAINIKADLATLKSQVQPSTTKLKQNTEKLFKFFQDKIGSTSNSSLLEDVLRLFNDSKDFFFCRQRNVTISAQRFFTERSNKSEESFFWNKYMLESLMTVAKENYTNWTCPIMQGYVSTTQLEITDQINVFLNITIISRRSTHRAGARYLRRGIDEESNVANFVETELILNIFQHELSYVQIRGSVPIFWSQHGYKYRPPLIINRTIEETHGYFEEHIKRLLSHYGDPLVAVSLVDQRGRELGLAQRYLEHCAKLDDDKMAFFSFDLHNHCRGLNFQKLQNLIGSMEETLKTIGFCWIDRTGEVVQRQNGVVRTNCVDCLDRTNLVQGSISLHIVLLQAQRLGIFGPLCEPPEALVSTLQVLWADNGDAISTQYAGTAALKGDVTRSGERKLAGIMKDGYNSASRYYLTHTRDAARQKAINLVTRQVEDESNMISCSESENDEEENMTRLVSETIQFLVPQQHVVIAGWGLIDACSGNDEIDTIVILTRQKMYIATYEIDGEKMSDVQIVALDDVRTVEVGQGGSKQCVRIEALEEMFIWKPGKMRLFNNVAIRLKSIDESNEYLMSIAEQINVGRNMLTGGNSVVRTVKKLTIPQMSAHRRSLAAMGSLLTKIKKSNRKNPSPNMTKSASAIPITNDHADSSDGNVSDSVKDNDDLMSKFLGRALKKAEEQPSPFANILPMISQSQTKISLL